MSDFTIKTYHIKHSIDFTKELKSAKQVAEYAIKNKFNRKLLTTKYVKQFDLPSAISCQILRKYSRDKKIKKVTNINLIVPNQITKHPKKHYDSIIFDNGIVTLKPLKISFRWNPGRKFEKINQVEISNDRFMIAVSFKKQSTVQIPNNDQHVLGVDLNCGYGRHIANCANLSNGHVLDLGKSGPNIRKQYAVKRKQQKIKNNREQRKTKDLDHQISRKIVNYALKNKLKIILENLTNIRSTSTKGEGSNRFKNKSKNRIVNSWSFYRLQTFIGYKAKEHGIPVVFVHPHYTSQNCSYCGVTGTRDKDTFECVNKKCYSYSVKRNSDRNAAFNIAKRSLEEGGITTRSYKPRKNKTVNCLPNS